MFAIAFITMLISACVLAIMRPAMSPGVNITVAALGFFFGYILLRRSSLKASIAESDRELLTGTALQKPEVINSYRALRELRLYLVFSAVSA